MCLWAVCRTLSPRLSCLRVNVLSLSTADVRKRDESGSLEEEHEATDGRKVDPCMTAWNQAPRPIALDYDTKEK